MSSCTHSLQSLRLIPAAVLPPAPEPVAPGGDDVEAGAGGRGTARLDRAVPPALELGWVVAPWRYRLPLETVGSSALSAPDWSI
jgi:hypothetical protein